jgi:hypothetical protein
MSSATTTSQPPDAPHASIPRLAFGSAKHFLSLARHGSLRRPPQRLGRAYRVDDGRAYEIFRETVSDAAPTDPANVLVVGFQLKVLGAHPVPHWIFQRCCLLTTPFWSGLPGFSVKLWMVDPESKRYLGIYDWRGLANTQAYVDALARVLRPLSTADSVWYRIVPDRTLEAYLTDHTAERSL